MSRMIPQRVADTLRQYNDLSVDLYGIDCSLFINTNPNVVANLDEYAKPSDYAFKEYKTKVWVDWSPNKHRLRKLGLFVEGELPILAWFSNKIFDTTSNVADIDVIPGSYFTVDIQYIPLNEVKADEFEIVDIIIPSAHDAVITKYFKIAPRRVKEE